jgi:hypothetical protein
MLNGINPVATAQDLIDRSVRIELEPIQKRRRAAALEAEFEAARPEILGGLLDLFSRVLSLFPDVEIADPPRMADFGQLRQAVYQALRVDADFCVDYRARRARAIELGIDASPAAAAARELAEERGGFEGTLKGLLDTLTDYKHGEANWPRSAKGLSDILHRQAPTLDSVGVKVTFDPRRHRDGYHIRIERDPPCADTAVRVPRALLLGRVKGPTP